MMNNWDDEEEEQQKIKIPKYKIFTKDMDRKMIDKILEYTVLSLPDCEFDKQICSKLKRKLDEDPELNQPSITSAEKNIEEHGVWQVIIGKSYASSITFDTKYLFYFYFEDIAKYFLVFRS